MEGTQGLQGRKIALLIDFDNVVLGVDDPGFDPELVVNALRSRGVVVMGRAYGDWYRHNRHRRKLMEQGIELVETPVFGPVIKNSADIRIVLDAFEIAMLQHHIDAFCLVSGDSDFLPLIKKLQYLGKHVIVISGNKFTSDLVRRNCNEFVSYENLVAESLGATEDASTLEGSFALLARGIATLHERGMEVRSSTVKQMMLQLNPAFSERNFGCAQFKQFLDKAVRAGVVKLGGRDTTSGEFMVFLPTDLDETDTDKLEKAAAIKAPAPDKEPRDREPRDREPRDREPRDRKGRRDRSEAPAETAAISPVELGVAAAGNAPETAPAAPVEKPADLNDGGKSGEVRPTTASHLLSRGMRRGRLRFSGKAGRAEIAGETPSETVSETTPEATSETTPETADVTPENVPAAIEAQAIADAVPEAGETLAAPEETSPETSEETAEAAPKKRATRRGGKGRKTKAKPDADAADAPAEAPADSVTATPAPAEVSETASDAVSTPEVAIEATASAAPQETSEVAEPTAEPTAEAPAAPNPIDVGIAASAPAKRRPARRRPAANSAGNSAKGAAKAPAKKKAE